MEGFKHSVQSQIKNKSSFNYWWNQYPLAVRQYESSVWKAEPVESNVIASCSPLSTHFNRIPHEKRDLVRTKVIEKRLEAVLRNQMSWWTFLWFSFLFDFLLEQQFVVFQHWIRPKEQFYSETRKGFKWGFRYWLMWEARVESISMPDTFATRKAA